MRVRSTSEALNLRASSCELDEAHARQLVHVFADRLLRQHEVAACVFERHGLGGVEQLSSCDCVEKQGCVRGQRMFLLRSSSRRTVALSSWSILAAELLDQGFLHAFDESEDGVYEEREFPAVRLSSASVNAL